MLFTTHTLGSDATRQAVTGPAASSRCDASRLRWTGWILSGLALLLLSVDAAGKLLQVDPVVQGTARLGYPAQAVATIGALELAALLAYAVPGSAVLGALLLTGFFGGAVATHLRIGDPLWSHVLSPVYMALFVWAGLWLREPRLRALLPLRRAPGAA